MPRKKPTATTTTAPENPAAPAVSSPEPTTPPEAVGTDAPASRRNKVRSRNMTPKGDDRPLEERAEEYDLSEIGEYSTEVKDFAKKFDAPADEAEPETPAPEAAKPQEQAPAPEAPKHSLHLIALGREFGLTDADMAQASEEVLTGWIQGQIRAARSQPQQVAPAPKEPEPEVSVFDKYTDLDDELRAKLKAMESDSKESRKLAEALQAKLAAIENERASMTANEQIDAAFSDLKNTKFFGEGTVDKFKAEDPAFKNRMIVIRNLQANPIKGVSLSEAVKIRAKELFPVAEAAAASESPKSKSIEEILASRKGEWRNGSLAAPTQRETDKVPGRKGEVQRLAASLKEAGLWNGTVIADDEDELDGLLD